MATFELTGPDGGTYHVDAPDEGAALKAFGAFNGGKSAPAAPAAAPADPVSINNVARSAATGVPIVGGLLNKADAATNAALAPYLNRFFDPKDQLPEENFSDRYTHSLRDQNGADAKFESQHPIIDTGAKLAGGMAAMAPAVAVAPALFGASGGLATRVGAGVASNAVLGGADAAVRGGSPVSGAIVGGLAGGALPAVGALAGKITAPIFANIKAMRDPEGFARSQFARGISESGQTPEQIGRAVQEANAAGQPLTPADALGPAGQKMLAAAARGPGEANTNITNFLNNRQAGQGRRVVNTLTDGFDSPQTAAQTEAHLTAARGTAADREYGAVRNDAQPVDVSNVLNHIDETLKPLGVPLDRVTMDGITGSLQRYRNMLGGKGIKLDGSADGGVNDFSSAQMVRSELSDEVSRAVRAGENDKARRLGGVLRQLDTSLENSSTGFRQANANFARASRDIDAIDTGRTAQARGRTEDTIPAFQALPESGKSAFRAGYVDKPIADTQGAPLGANKARPFTADAFRDEAAAMAPRNAQMQQNLARENTMFETRNRVLGNSKTVENAADDAAMSVDPHLISVAGHIMHGNMFGAIAGVGKLVANGWTGNTPAVRASLGRMLLDRGVSPARLHEAIGQTVARIHFIQNISRNVGRDAAGALAVNAPGQKAN